MGPHTALAEELRSTAALSADVLAAHEADRSAALGEALERRHRAVFGFDDLRPGMRVLPAERSAFLG